MASMLPITTQMQISNNRNLTLMSCLKEYGYTVMSQALGSRIIVFFNFINKMCIYNVYEPV